MQDARQEGLKCAGCSSEVGTEVCTPPGRSEGQVPPGLVISCPHQYWFAMPARSSPDRCQASKRVETREVLPGTCRSPWKTGTVSGGSPIPFGDLLQALSNTEADLRSVSRRDASGIGSDRGRLVICERSGHEPAVVGEVPSELLEWNADGQSGAATKSLDQRGDVAFIRHRDSRQQRTIGQGN